MTVSLTTRLGIHRWSEDTDPWDRSHFDDDNAALEALAIIGTQGTQAARPVAGVQRRLYLATDVERVYVDDGDEWYELAVLGTLANFTGGLQSNGVAVLTTAHTSATTGAHAASAISNTPAGNIAATTVQAAIDELDAEKASTGHTHAASAISNTPAGNIAATTVQAAIDELDAEKASTGHTHAASAITSTATGDVAATNVQAAIDELASEKLAKAGGTVTGLVTFSSSPALDNGVDLTIGTGTGSRIGQAASKLGFFGATPAARPGTYNLSGAADRTLGAYASDPESTAYTGALDGEAKLADLNALRVAYENLRAYVEDLGGVVVGTATDLKTLGLLG